MAKKAAAQAEVKSIKVTLVKSANGILKNQKPTSKHSDCTKSAMRESSLTTLAFAEKSPKFLTL